MRSLFIATAVIEIGAGLALAIAPALAVRLLLDAPLDAPGTLVGRVAGAALFALGTACWIARNDKAGRAGLFVGIFIYNVAVLALLVYAGLGLELAGLGLWPTVALHSVMAAWCGVAAIRRR